MLAVLVVAEVCATTTLSLKYCAVTFATQGRMNPAGFDHVIANMFLVPFGMKLGSGVSVGTYIWRSMIPVYIFPAPEVWILFLLPHLPIVV